MDDDLPKEGELFDLNKKYTGSPRAPLLSGEKPKVGAPVGIIIAIVLFAVVIIYAKGGFGAKESKQTINTYRQGTQSVFEAMKSQYPYLLNVLCEGSDPTKEDCVNFVGTFRPNKENAAYLTQMETSGEVSGASSADIATIKDTIKTLVDIKRSTLTSTRKPLTFLIDSVTVTRIGQEVMVTTKCTEDSKETVVCVGGR